MRFRSILTFGPSILLKISLLTIILLVGCAPASAPDTAQPAQPAVVEDEPTAAAPLPAATVMPPEVAPTDAPASQVPTEAPQVVATSRGPDLEATDPATVSLNSGELQFVEFFRFT